VIFLRPPDVWAAFPFASRGRWERDSWRVAHWRQFWRSQLLRNLFLSEDRMSLSLGAIRGCGLQRKQTGPEQHHHQSEIAGQLTGGNEYDEPGRLHMILNH
jgi:hypothetical protein